MKHEEIRGKKLYCAGKEKKTLRFSPIGLISRRLCFNADLRRQPMKKRRKELLTSATNRKTRFGLRLLILTVILLARPVCSVCFAWHQTDLTIIIPDPAMQHKGYGSEAIRIMLDMAFHEYEMHRVSIGVVGLNTDALEFYKKIGFKQEGILEEAYYYNDEYSDFIMMRILSQEWK